MKKRILLALLMILIIAGGIFAFSKWKVNGKEEPNIEYKSNKNLGIVLSLEDEISDNTAWCGTFNLIWNDLKNDLAKQDILFTPQKKLVENLNKGTFNTSHLSENSYYKVYGRPTLELKAEIEKAIQEKFNETSDILDDFDWNNRNPEDYFLYTMLKKEFEFPKAFSELEEGTFGNYENVTYFGIDESTDEQVRKQVEVLYYHSKDDFAVKLFTKENDEVILAKGREENSFGKMYETIQKEKENYEGEISFGEEDILKIPNIKFNLKEEFHELENEPFLFSNGNEYQIETALQTIQFELDKKGGKIKSEAGMMVRKMAIMMPEEPRQFLVDDTFTIFLLEENRDLPYFAAKISDITAVQNQASKSGSSQNADTEEKVYFYGKVIESNQNSIVVEPNEDEEIRKSADKISIALEKNLDYMYEVGTNVKITYNGVIMETYPAQVEAMDIEIKSAENFEIHFVNQQHESRDKVRPILEKTETEKYDYNIYAYLGEVNIVINGKEMPLREALLENKITMDEIIAKANEDVDSEKIKGDMYNDGGSMIYRYEEYTIIKVHNLDGNRDVYIGIPEMELKDVKS